MSNKIENEIIAGEGSDTVSAEQVPANNIPASKKKENSIVQTTKRKDAKRRKDGTHARTKFNDAEKVVMRNADMLGMGSKEIAIMVNSTPATVRSVLCRYRKQFKGLDQVDDFKQIRSDILTASEYSVLESINKPGKMDAASLGELAKMFSVIHTANRLERNLSTANSHSVTFTGNAEQIDAYRNRS